MESFDMSRFDPSYDASRNGANKLVVKFRHQPVQNPSKSKDAGRPIYDDAVFIVKTVPGSNDIIDRPARPSEFEEFAPQYQHFLRTKGEGPEFMTGTPLNQVPLFSAARVAEFNDANIFTLEQVAELSDTHISRLGHGTRELVNQARTLVKAAKDSSHITKLQADYEELKSANEALSQTVEELRAELGGLKAANGSDLTKRRKTSE